MISGKTKSQQTAYSFYPTLFCLSLAVLGGALLRSALFLPSTYYELLLFFPKLELPFIEINMIGTMKTLRATIFIAGTVCSVASLLGVFRYAWALSLIRGALLVSGFAMMAYVYAMMRVTSIFLEKMIPIDGMEPTPVVLFFWRWHWLWPVLLATLFFAALYVLSWTRKVITLYSNVSDESPATGDRIIENIRSNGREAMLRKSIYGSAGTHLVVLVLIPILLSTRGCVEPYKIPKGSGSPAVSVQVVKVAKQKKKEKKRKRTILNPNSAIIFEMPDLDNPESDQVMDEQSELTYKTQQANANAGKMGAGGGKKGGWPSGMDDYKIRFIRLNHGGPAWDDGMDSSNADINFLRQFAKVTGFNKIASKSENHSIALLAKYPKDAFPPFVYMTGSANIGQTTPADAKILREYCLNGGMLIADAGSLEFHKSFTRFMHQVFPDKPLLDISDDDMIYQQPYQFPDGAPAFWHHGGRRAMGVKHENRWIVFYHPGDMKDAWKSPGYTDVKPEMRESAMNLGVNLLYYAFTRWNDEVGKKRK